MQWRSAASIEMISGLIALRQFLRYWQPPFAALWATGLAFLGYASLAPQLAPPTGIAGVELRLDTFIHVGVYLCFAAWPWIIGNDVRRAWLATAIVAILSVAFEIGQAYVPGRSASWDDLAANALGVVLGVWLGRRIAAL